MRELVFVGERGTGCSTNGSRAIDAFIPVLDALGLPAEIRTASDPFFVAPEASAKTYFQLSSETKYEISVESVADERLAVGSFNYHTDFFGKAFGTNAADDRCRTFRVRRLRTRATGPRGSRSLRHDSDGMAGNPAPPAVIVELIEGDRSLERWLAAASQLITAEFPRPALETSADLLRWHLTGIAFDDIRPLAVTATLNGDLVGFAAATPRPLRCGADAGVAHVVSFVCVASSARGCGIASRLYDTLLEGVAQRSGRALTFAIDGSPGMAALESAYARHGFAEQALGLMPPYAVMRGRIGTGSAPMARRAAPTLTLADSVALRRHLDGDPRGSRLVGGYHARATAAARVTTDAVEPILLLETLPEPFESITAQEAVAATFDAFPDHGKLLVVPNYPATGGEIARAVGLRRLAGPVYRTWFWSRLGGDPLLQAQETSHPVL